MKVVMGGRGIWAEHSEPITGNFRPFYSILYMLPKKVREGGGDSTTQCLFTILYVNKKKYLLQENSATCLPCKKQFIS